MKIFIPFKIKDIGGTATFVKKFSAAVEKKGLSISQDFSFDFDILFIVGDCPLSQYFQSLFIAKILKKRIIQRLDGIYTSSSSVGKLYWLYNLKIKIIHNYFADFVVYQSHYSKSAWETICRKKKKNWTVIYNGVDTEKIRPNEKWQQESAPIKLLTFGQFRRKDQIKPLIESVRLLEPRDYSFDIYGTYTNNMKSIFSNPENIPNIHFHGKLSNENLFQKIIEYDIFLFSDQSACPNSVIEAMAAGLPVIAFERGSINELITSGYNGYVVKTKKHNPFRDSYPFTSESFNDFSRSIENIIPNLKQYKESSRLVAEKRFRLDASVDEYIKIFKSYDETHH